MDTKAMRYLLLKGPCIQKIEAMKMAKRSRPFSEIRIVGENFLCSYLYGAYKGPKGEGDGYDSIMHLVHEGRVY